MEATKEQSENIATVNSQNVKEESTMEDSSPELSLVEFCTQLDDYTPTVSFIINKSTSILLYVLLLRYQMQSLFTISKLLVLTLMIQECKELIHVMYYVYNHMTPVMS